MRALHIILCAVVLIVGAACSRHVTTSTATASTAVRVDTVHIIQRSADTIRQRDSVIIDREGDTIRIRQVQWRDRVSIMRDTVTVYHTDTVTITEQTTTAAPAADRSIWSKIVEWLALIGALAVVAVVIWCRTKPH